MLEMEWSCSGSTSICPVPLSSVAVRGGEADLQPVFGCLAPAGHTHAVVHHTRTPSCFSFPATMCVYDYVRLCLTGPEELQLLRLINITERNPEEEKRAVCLCFGLVVQLCQTDSTRGWQLHIHEMLRLYYCVLSKAENRELKTLLTCWCFSLCRKK